MSNVIETSRIVNTISFKIDQGSYKRALNAIRKISSEWARATNKMSGAMVRGKSIAANPAVTAAREQVKSAKQQAQIRQRSEKAVSKEWGNRRKQAIKDITQTGGGKASKTAFADMLRQEQSSLDARSKMWGQRRRQSVSGITSSTGAGKASNTAFADMLKDEERKQKILARQQNMQQRVSNRNANTIATASIGRDPSFIKSYASQIGVLNQQLKAGVITSAQYNKHLNSMARDFRNAQNSAGGLLSTAKELRSAFVALTATYTAFAGGKAIMTTGQMFQGIEAGMNMASTDANAAAQQIQFLREEAYRLGLDLKIAAQGFTQMSVAGKEILKPTEIQSLFTGLSEYSTALGVDSFRYEKAVLAIGQMLN